MRTKILNADKKLRQSEMLFRNLFKDTNEGFCVIEVIFSAQAKPIDWRYLEVNSAFEEKAGLRNVKGKLVSQLVKNLEAHWFEFYGQIALSGKPARRTSEALAPNRWFEVSAFRLGGTKSRKVAVLFDDVTERKWAEVLHSHLSAIVQSSNDAIISTDLDGVIMSWNKGAERLFGYSEKEIIGQPVNMFIPSDCVDESSSMMSRIFREKMIENYDTVRRHKDGTMIDISMTVSRILNNEGRMVGVSKIAHDISERKRAEALNVIFEANKAAQERIGNDLHEGICQELTGLALLMKAMAQKLSATAPNQSVEATEVSQLIGQSIDKARNLALKLTSEESENSRSTLAA